MALNTIPPALNTFRGLLQGRGIAFDQCVSLARLTTIGVGNRVQFWVRPSTTEQALELFAMAQNLDLPIWIHGKGTNVLFALDEDPYPGVLVSWIPNDSFGIPSELERSSTIHVSSVHAGLSKAQVCRVLAKHQIPSAVWMQGIPGTLAGGIVMNAGTPNGYFSDIVGDVTVLDFSDQTQKHIKTSPEQFGYRTQTLCSPHQMITACSLQLPIPQDKESFDAAFMKARHHRYTSQPVGQKTFGSTFKNPSNGFAGALLSSSGLKGKQVGGAMISPKHANFFVNTGSATAQDMLDLIHFSQACVLKNHGVALDLEVNIVRQFYQWH